jgi:hypothetical protein
MAPAVRQFVLTVHLTSSLGRLGAVVAYIAVGVTAATSQDAQTVRGAWIAMELTGWHVIVPLALAALLTGLVIAVGTQWGLIRHYWVLISLGLTFLATVILVLHMPSVSATTRIAREANDTQLFQLGGDLGHAVGGVLVLLLITVLNVYKPRGLTPYGWRKQEQSRTALLARSHPASPASPEFARDR